MASGGVPTTLNAAPSSQAWEPLNMTKSKILPIEEIRKIIRVYAPDGTVKWRRRTPDMFPAFKRRSQQELCDTWNKAFAGIPCFKTLLPTGHLSGAIFGRVYRTDKVIWALEYGKWPTRKLIHINGNIRDNRITNLALKPKYQPTQKRKLIPGKDR